MKLDSMSPLDSASALDSTLCFCESWLDCVGDFAMFRICKARV
ncbi:hypothetical protein [uncultured Helicobacter sp.]